MVSATTRRRIEAPGPLPGLARGLVLAAACFAAGKLSLLLAIPPGYATAVWPAAGIALAGVLLWGPVAVLGVGLGSFLTHIAASGAAADDARGVAIAAAIAFGAALQALVGSILIRRTVGSVPPLVRDGEIIRFVVLGGPIACVVRATCGVAALVVSGVDSPDAAAFSWFTWWIGDTIGVLIFAPLILLPFAPPAEARRRWLSVGGPLLATFATTVAVFVYARHWESTRARHDFERHAENLSRAIEVDVADYVAVLRSVVALFAGSHTVERSEFGAFVNGLLAQHPGMHGLSWNARVSADEREAFERSVRSEGFPHFQITERDAQHRLVPAARRSEYVPVTYVEPEPANERALGFDTASSSERRHLQAQARDSGELAVIARVRLVQQQDEGVSALLCVPVFRNGRPHATIEERRANVQGYLAGLLRIDDMVATALRGADLEGVVLRIEDDRAPAEARLLWGTPGGADPDEFAYHRSLESAGLRWSLHVERDTRYLVAHRSLSSWFVLLGGLLLDSLLGTFLLMMTGRTARIESLVSERTQQLSLAMDALEQELLDGELVQHALRSSENQLRSVTESANDAIIIANADGRILRWNFAAERCFGYSEQEAIGVSVSMLVPERLRGAHEAGMARLRAGEVPGLVDRTLEVRGLRKDAAEMPLEISLSTWCSDDGTYFCAIVRDIRERHRAALELQRAKEAAEAGNRAKGDFLANMSHEIRTPMNAVIGMTGLLRATQLDPRQREFVETIRLSGEHLLTVINEILDLSKIEAGHLDLEMSRFDVRRFVAETLELIAPRAVEKGLALRHRVEAAVPAVISTDAGRLRQVLVNLLGNAVKFTERGGVEVELQARALESADAERGRCELHFLVRDTGFGIRGEQVERLFEPFTQADASVTRRFGGTGLGLTISKRLCERLGGRIWVESEVSRGSTFHFTIAADLVAPLDAVVAEPAPARPEPVVRRATAAHCSILLAEDNSVNQKVAKLILEQLGYSDVDTVGNGIEVIAALERRSYDIVIMDVQMPDMDGIDATRWIRGRWKRAPKIIALTAHALSGDRERCIQAGMDGYLTKPIQAAELEAELLRLDAEATGAPRVRVPDARRRLAPLHAQIADLRVVSEIVDEFAAEARGAEALLHAAFAQRDAKSARRLAHTLGSTAALVGAGELSLLAREIERLAMAEDTAGALARMRGLAEAVEHALGAVIAERDALVGEGEAA